LAELGRRIFILDEENFPRPTIEGLVAELQGLQSQERDHTRALIIVDYLQAFPLPGGPDSALALERDADMWRVGALKNLRDLSGEAVLAISEVVNPCWARPGAGALSDIAGSSRAICTPDMVFLLQTLGEEKSLRQVGGDPRAAKQQMQQLNIAFLRLAVAKGRDSVVRDTINLIFYYYRQFCFAEGFRRFI